VVAKSIFFVTLAAIAGPVFGVALFVLMQGI
jgi:hypothetical protein